jgi:hypothetical protein
VSSVGASFVAGGRGQRLLYDAFTLPTTDQGNAEQAQLDLGAVDLVADVIADFPEYPAGDGRLVPRDWVGML